MALNWQEHLILLGSQSPRRAALLEEMGLQFRQAPADIKEHYPADLKGSEIAEYLAAKKAEALKDLRKSHEILLCSDTVVWLENQSLEKASNRDEAMEMLTALSGKTHEVITGLYLGDGSKEILLHDRTKVKFKSLSLAEIEYYIEHFKPFDKAGAYGIQEWIGMIGIEAIEGSYFTVMGLPCHRIAAELQKW